MHRRLPKTSNDLEQCIDSIDLLDFFPENFLYFFWEYNHWIRYWEIYCRANTEFYLRYRTLWNIYVLDTLYAPWKGSEMMLALFHLASTWGIKTIQLNARTNDEERKTQEELEFWYRKFWFETLSRDIDGTKMRANVVNWPIVYRFRELIDKVEILSSRILDTHDYLTQSPPSV